MARRSSTRERRRWSELSPTAKAGAVAGTAVQLGLLAAALADLRRRDPAELNGPRWAWVLASFVNFVGPLAYFAVGRRKPRTGTVAQPGS
jgi:hypothetical protein